MGASFEFHPDNDHALFISWGASFMQQVLRTKQICIFTITPISVCDCEPTFNNLKYTTM